jgi:hypothetical protein
MRGDRLPDQDHVSRYCRPKTLQEDGQPSGASFMLRPGEEFLSVNWLEYFDVPDRRAQITQVRRVLTLTRQTTAKIAVLNVGGILDHVHRNSDRVLAVLHEPEQDDPSHSGIHGYGYGHEYDLVADLIAEEVRETYPAKEN